MSHIICMQKAARADEASEIEFARLAPPEDRPERASGGKEIDPDDLIDPKSLSNPDPAVLVLLLNGNEHNVLAFYNHPQPIWSMYPGQSSAPTNVDGKTFVPFEVLKSMVVRRRISSRRRTQALLDMFKGCKPIFAAPPPPVDDIGQLTELTGRMQSFAEHGITEPNTRLAAYAAVTSTIREEAADFGGMFVSAPPEALTPDGFLRADLSVDRTHGTEAYGRLMLDRILAAATADHSLETT